MAVFSIVQRRNIGKGNRLDPDYYQPAFLQLGDRLTNSVIKEKGVLRNYIHSAINFGAYSLCNYIVFVNNGVPYLYTQDVRDNFIDLDNLHYIPAEVDEILYKSKVSNRQVLITMAGIYLGRVAVFDYGVQANSNQAIAKITVREEILNPYFLSTFLGSLYGNFQIKRNKTGTARDNLNLGQIQDLFICVPSKAFQKSIEIAVKLGKQRLSDSKQLYSQAEQLLLTELGLDNWIPPRKLTYVRKYSEASQSRRIDAEYFQPKYQAMFNKLKSNINLVRLGKLVTLTKGIEVGSEAYQDSGVPFWRVSNLTKRGLDDANAKFISEELYRQLQKAYEPQKGEILLSKDATPGLAFYLENAIQGIVSSAILRLALVADIPPHYLEFVLNSMFAQMQIEQDAGGSIIKHWKPSEVRSTLVPRLVKEKENEIAALVKQSHIARKEAKDLLEKSRRAVEIAIEEGEDKAMRFLKKQ